MKTIIINCNRGYTYIELLIAITILGLIITPFLMMFSGSYMAINNAGKQSMAINLCRQQIEIIKSLGYYSAYELYSGYGVAKLSEYPPIYIEENIDTCDGFTRITSIEPIIFSCQNDHSLQVNILLIEVTVIWTEFDRPNSEQLRSLLSIR